MWLVAGLGNPGAKYQRNRHNIGFRVVDELARRHLDSGFRGNLGAEVAAGMLSIAGRNYKVQLAKPMEFMNRSGLALSRLARYYDIEPEAIVVVHDEIDIEFGRLKLKSGGGHGGHNGLRSIIQQLGSREFIRVRVGVGRPGPSRPSASEDGGQASSPASSQRRAGGRDPRVSGHVLSDFPSALDSEV
ncbi:MAG: aminoacyl-tRNA hydrolase, partial [Myxococcota bacterium]